MRANSQALIDVSDLAVSYRQGRQWQRVVDGVSFKVVPGEVFGLVGESGCGKSTVALQLLGYRQDAMRVDRGHVMVAGDDVLKLDRLALDRIRGAKVSFVPQNPTTALNPGMRVGAQIEEILEAHGRGDFAKRTRELFALVGMPDDVEFQRRYPHQLSGGQQQRVCIAMALACDPQFVILDEPTTGLDVTTQEQIVELLIALRTRLSMSMLYVTHDLALLSQLADRIGVMYAGRMVEVAPTMDLFASPRHPYTRGLIGVIPQIDDFSRGGTQPLRGLLQRELLPKGCPFAPRCDYAVEQCSDMVQTLHPCGPSHEVACWRIDCIPRQKIAPQMSKLSRLPPAAKVLEVAGVTVTYGGGKKRFKALKDVTLDVARGETVALVGESGSGKSTLAKAIAGLVTPENGEIKLDGAILTDSIRQRTGTQRRLIQYVFQNPDASLNPRATIAACLERPFSFFFQERSTDTSRQVLAALSDVRLDASYASRYPDQLSGGERQRVAIARALIAEPELLLCDEILSALDVSVQANILDLLQRLKMERAIAMLFISHDLAVVRMLADRVCVLFRGEIVESGTSDDVFRPPFHPYTHSLLEAVPSPNKVLRAVVRSRPESSASTKGCAYAGRCAWQLGAICETEPPPVRSGSGSHTIRCHLTLDKLSDRMV